MLFVYQLEQFAWEMGIMKITPQCVFEIIKKITAVIQIQFQTL
jgi:hypothetical protein